jgi:hypothetical protein
MAILSDQLPTFDLFVDIEYEVFYTYVYRLKKGDFILIDYIVFELVHPIHWKSHHGGLNFYTLTIEPIAILPDAPKDKHNLNCFIDNYRGKRTWGNQAINKININNIA